MAFQVIDAAGRLIELEDGKPVPPGCKLMVSPLWMDSEQRANAAAYPPKPGPHDDEDEGDQVDSSSPGRRKRTLRMKTRLGTPKTKRQPVPLEEAQAARARGRCSIRTSERASPINNGVET